MHPVTKKYTPGDKWLECPVCGFDVLRSQTVIDPNTKLSVCKKCKDDPEPRRGK